MIPAQDSNTFRISCFQAKNADSRKSIDLSRAPKFDDDPLGRAAAVEADGRLVEWALGNPPYTRPNGKDHQMLKMALLQEEGRKELSESASIVGDSWVHYVLWQNAANPLAFSLDAVRELCAASKKPIERLDTSIIPSIVSSLCRLERAPENSVDLGMHLMEGLTVQHPGWIDVSFTDAQRIVGKTVELGTDWYSIDDRDGGRTHQLLARQDFVDKLDFPALRSTISEMDPPRNLNDEDDEDNDEPPDTPPSTPRNRPQNEVTIFLPLIWSEMVLQGSMAPGYEFPEVLAEPNHHKTDGSDYSVSAAKALAACSLSKCP